MEFISDLDRDRQRERCVPRRQASLHRPAAGRSFPLPEKTQTPAETCALLDIPAPIVETSLDRELLDERPLRRPLYVRPTAPIGVPSS